MTPKINIPLLILDFIILLPVTILRLVLIYLYGSRYNIELLDVMMHAETAKFNNGKNTITTVKTGAANVLQQILEQNKQVPVNNNIKRVLSDKSISLESPSSSKTKSTKIETTIDNDLDNLTNMISGLIEQRKKVKEEKKEQEKKNASEIEISTDSSIVENKFIEVDEESTEQDDESFSFMFSEDRKKLSSLI